MAYTFKTIFETAREQGFQQGFEIGFQRGVESAFQAVVLINSTDKSDATIAKEINLSEEFVKKVRQAVNKKRLIFPS